MKNLRIVRLLLLPTVLAGLSAASMSWADSEYVPAESEANKYSAAQAADIVQSGFARCVAGGRAQVQVMPDIITRSIGESFEVIQLRDLGGIHLAFIDSNAFFSRKRSLSLSMQGHFFLNGRNKTESGLRCTGLAENWTKDLGDALLRLRLEYDKANSPEAMAKFEKEAIRYRETNPKPELPEDARRFRVQAEGAVQAKRFLEAADGYGKAIEIAPWWPEAHFNRAVVLAELQNFDSAMAEMKRYLLLKPEAPDARQARDLIYAWEAHPFEKK